MAEAKDKKILIRRIIMTVLGVMFLGVAVGFLDAANFGLDPFQTMCRGIWRHTGPKEYGTFYAIVSVIELIVIFLIDKSKIGLGTLINLFILGYIADYSGIGLKYILSLTGDSIILRVIYLAAGLVLMSLCSAIYFVANMGVSTHDAVSLIASEKQNKIQFSWLRVANDVFCVVVGVVLGQAFGIGTILVAFFTGPLVAFFRKHVGEPLLNR